jgi:hypothetical protein
MPRKPGKSMDVETEKEAAQRKREDEENAQLMSLETEEETAEREAKEKAEEKARVDRLPGARRDKPMEFNTPEEETERERMNAKSAAEKASQKELAKFAPNIRKALNRYQEEQQNATVPMAIDQEKSGQKAPGNPFDLGGICSQVALEDGRANIYLLRYQTPEVLMSRQFMTLFKQVYLSLNTTYFGEQAALIGLGYFYLKYDGKGGMSAEIFDTETIPFAMGSFGGYKPALTTAQFFEAGANVAGFSNLVKAIVYKSFLELFIQLNLRSNVPFECRVGLDLYATRSPQQALLFHKDETLSISTQFATLTYMIEDPSIIIKGPTLVATKDAPVKASFTPAVRHGITVGFNNKMFDHSSPSPEISIPTGAEKIWATTNVGYQRETSNFTLSDLRNSAIYTGPELAADPTARQEQIAKVQSNTATTQRSFIRAWYITGFLRDSDAHAVPIEWLELSWDYMVALVSDVKARTCFVNVSPLLSADDVIKSPTQQGMTFGGAETVVETAPLQYDAPFIEKKGPIGSNEDAIAKKGKPIIKDVVASPEFQKLLASTDNFILGAVVKDAALPMGGKHVAKSKRGKKRTMKRVKRSSTRRRMVKRKQKTRIRTKRTKTRR